MEQDNRRGWTRYMPMAIGLGMLALYGIGTAFPKSWWGLHFAAFLPAAEAGIYFLLAIGALIAGPFLGRALEKRWEGSSMGKWAVWAVPIGGAMLFTLLFFNTQLKYDYYGDAPKFEEAFQNAAASRAPVHTELITDLNILHPKNGERTVLNSVRALSTFPGEDYRDAFRKWNAFWGGLYVLGWLGFVLLYFESHTSRLAFSILGLGTPILYQFLGHVEIYAPSITMLLWLSAAIAMFYKTRNRIYFWAIFPLWFLSMKFHVTGYLFFPAILLIVLGQLSATKALSQKLLRPKATLLFLILPLTLMGLVVYFFVLGDHNDPRTLSGNEDVLERLFLPIIKPEPPFDRYTLLGGSHLFDYFNLLFLWSAPAIFVTVLVLLGKSRQKAISQIPALLLGTTLFLYAAFFFGMNPLLSMPIDWDLFALPAPLLLVWAAILGRVLESRGFSAKLIGGVLALSIMAIPFFRAHASTEGLSKRLVATGIHVFKTYWIRSAGDIQAGWKAANDLEAFLESGDEVLEELEPYALKGNDPEYANLNWFVGKHHGVVRNDPAKALTYHLKAEQYQADASYVQTSIMESYFLLGDFRSAYNVSLKLMEIGEHGRERSLKIALNCALEAKMYAEALKHAEELVQNYEADPGLQEMYRNLQAGTNLEQLVSYFRGG